MAKSCPSPVSSAVLIIYIHEPFRALLPSLHQMSDENLTPKAQGQILIDHLKSRVGVRSALARGVLDSDGQ